MDGAVLPEHTYWQSKRPPAAAQPAHRQTHEWCTRFLGYSLAKRAAAVSELHPQLAAIRHGDVSGKSHAHLPGVRVGASWAGGGQGDCTAALYL